MGGLTSTSATPKQKVVYVPTATTSTATTSTTSAGDTSSSSKDTAQEIAAEAREQSLLTRDRSRYGTVNTSFLGLLDQDDRQGQEDQQTMRKTLLGQ